ncbi:MAG: hypothetical protein KBT48_12130 [Firmicutes bacterium]|nr:hypothetical protein [Bacillota bacterium]
MIFSIKYWALDNRFDVIATGSLLGVSLKDGAYPVGYEKKEILYPLDFEEFLWAIGISEASISVLKPYFTNGERIPSVLNDKMFEYLKTYMIVGGMPAVVNVYLETHNFMEVDSIQQQLISSYEEDIAHYAQASDRIKAQACYKSIPLQLLKDNHKFQYKLVRKGSISSDYFNSFDWLEKAGLVQRCYNLQIPSFPIRGYLDQDKYKAYLNDIGLLISTYGIK